MKRVNLPPVSPNGVPVRSAIQARSRGTPNSIPNPALNRQPVPPPVYRPQPLPVVLQRKCVVGVRATTVQPAAPKKPNPTAPPAYHPQPAPAVLQRKMAVRQTSLQSKPAVVAPPAYRPQRVPAVLQSKVAAGKQLRKSGTPTHARIPSSATGTIQRMHPHFHDIGRDFLIKYPHASSSTSVGNYVGPVLATYQIETNNYESYEFDTNRFGVVSVPHQRIIGYRPTVGGMHPRGMIRSDQERIEGRSEVFLSEADLSGVMARQRRDPSLLDRVVVTTYEQAPNYPDYRENLLNLEGQGVPVLNNFDISDPEMAQRLSSLAPNSNIHFQMPRVPRIEGYSTQRLVADTLEMPHRLQRSDIAVSITTPHPSMYKKPGKHNQIYGLESGKVFGKNELVEAASDSDDDLEDYGYTHKQSTKNKSAKVAEKRKKYKFRSSQPYHCRSRNEIEKHHRRHDRDDDEGFGGGLSGQLLSKS